MPNSSTICVDANLVIRLVADANDELVHHLWERWDTEKKSLIAPHLLYFEVSNALHQYQKHGYLSPHAVGLALQAALALDIKLQGTNNLHQHALKIARRHALPAAYDAHYLALAQQFDAEFWTADRRLVHTVQNTLPWVHFVGAN
ncbi:MAG: type II toxin-antitoxin system VapC family toxin [Chloroflexi bacterium]|nr:type II toxin-antitoxin system VapC family toxin [Chloroflexota bacterium]